MLRTSLMVFVLLFSFSSVVQAKERMFSEAFVNFVSSLDAQLKKKYGTAIQFVPIIVTTPVNLNNFSQTNALARQVGQEIITQFVQKNYKVEEIRHAKEITTFADVGEFILSRGSVINAAYKIGFVVAATYTITGTGIRFTVEVINVNDSSIAAMEGLTLPFTKEIEALLLQNNSTNPQNNKSPVVSNNTIQNSATASTTVYTIPNDVY